MTDRPRKTRHAWNEAGQAHFLTYSCVHRWPLLSKDRARGWVVEAMEAARRRLDLALWAYVVMPEHVHLICLPLRPQYRTEQILACLKRNVSKQAKNHLTATGNRAWLERLTVTYSHRVVFRFWEPGGGYDRNIWHSRSVVEMMTYVHANPVRRGLVKDPLEWCWSSARFWDGDGTGPLRMDPLEL
jgi:putative transposase